MSLIAQLGWVQTGDLEVKGCGFCYQSSKLPIPQAEKHWLRQERGELFDSIHSYVTLLCWQIIFLNIITVQKTASFFLLEHM